MSDWSRIDAFAIREALRRDQYVSNGEGGLTARFESEQEFRAFLDRAWLRRA